MSAIFPRDREDVGALRWLLRGAALWLLDLVCRLTAPVLQRPALQGRVAGVGVVGVLPQGAGPGAEDEAPPWEEGPAQQGEPTAGTAETRLGSVPVLALVGHLTLVYTCSTHTGRRLHIN